MAEPFGVAWLMQHRMNNEDARGLMVLVALATIFVVAVLLVAIVEDWASKP